MSETIWSQANPTGASGYATTTENGSYGLYFTVSSACTLNAIWFYSPSGAASLPTSTALYSTTTGSPGTGTLIAQNASPSWSGAAGSGWVRDNSFPATALSTGTDYVSQYYGASFKQAYIYGGSGGAWLFPESSATLITAPATYGGGSYSNCPYLNSSNGYPSTTFGGSTINWLSDVEVSTGGGGGPAQIAGPAQYRYLPPAWHPASGPGMPGGEPFASYAAASYSPLIPQETPQAGPFRLFPATSGPGTATSNGGDWISGTAFQVTQGGQWFEGYWWWVCGSGQSTSPVKCALWNAYETSSFTGTVIPGTTVTSGTLTAGQWNYIPLSTPVPIAIGTVYIAAVGVNGNYPDTTAQFGSGDPYSAGITNGPLSAFSAQSGSSAPGYTSCGQGMYTNAGTDPSVTMPALPSATADNLWVDVQVSGQAPAGYSGPYPVWPNKYDADAYTTADSPVGYVVGTEFWLDEPCTVGSVRYFSPSGTAQLATEVTIWSVVTQAAVYDNASPSWSGAAASGWVSCAVAGVTLQPGAYRVTVFNNAGTPDQWSAKRFGYWGSYPSGGPLVTATGITLGPLFAPSAAQANNCYEYDNSGSTNTPPYSYPDGRQEPGQSVFAQSGSNTYPSLYVDGGFQNYWVDISVTAVATTASAGLAAGTGTAQSPVPDVIPAAGLAAGTGTAQPPSAVITPAAGLAAGSGTALAPVPVVTASAGLAAAAGAAQQPGISATAGAGLATGAGTGQAPVVVVTPAAGLPSGSGLAQAPALTVTVTAGLPTGAGTSQPPVPVVIADAGLATGAGTALQPTVNTSGSTTASAGLATAAGTAQGPVPVVIPASGLAAGAGTSQQPGPAVTPAAGLATGTGTALAPVPVVIVAAGLAAGTGAALQPTVNTSGSTTANAGLATASGAALQPAAVILVAASLAAGTGTAHAPVPAIAASPALASASGSAPMPVISVTVFAGLATATGTAQQPVAGIIFTANAGLAAAAGTAQQPGISVTVIAGLATGTGTAMNATGPSITTAVLFSVVTARQQWSVTTARQLWSVTTARSSQ